MGIYVGPWWGKLSPRRASFVGSFRVPPPGPLFLPPAQMSGQPHLQRGFRICALGHPTATTRSLPHTLSRPPQSPLPSCPLETIHLAAARGNVDICQLLHKFGADLLATDYQGNTALHLCGHVDTIQFLVSNGLKIDIW